MKFIHAEDVPIGDVFVNIDKYSDSKISFYQRVENEDKTSEFVHAMKLGEIDTGGGLRPYSFPPLAKVLV